MKKRTLLLSGATILAVGLAVTGLAACKKTAEDYTVEYGWEDTNDWRAVEYPDTDISVDGTVTAEEYGESHLSFSDVNGVNMKVYGHMGEEGVFFGFVSDDTLVNYNTKNDVFNNTSVEIQVAPFGTQTLNSNVVQLRFGADGTPDEWVGFRADDGYPYSKKYVPFTGAVHVNGTLNERAEGYSVELYLPYSAIGLTEKPASVVCAPSFNTMPDPYSSTRATWTMMLGCDLSQPATWYVVNQSGMATHTAGFKKDGTVIEQSGGYNEFYYFDSVPHESYYLKTKLKVTQGDNAFLNGDQYPKFGLVNRADSAFQSFHIDAAQRTAKNFGTMRAEPTTDAGTNMMWDTNASTSFAGHWAENVIGDYTETDLETIYYGGNLYFVLDGTLVKTVHDFAEGEGAIPGFMCFNTRATFHNNEYVTDEATVKAEAEKFMPKGVKIDGDLSDWTNADVNRHFRAAEDLNGNKIKVRAFRGDDGLYIAYEVHHLVLAPVVKWDTAWWENTNIEFFIGGTDNAQQYALTSFGTSGYMDAVMTTVRDQNRQYDTVGEIFVPFESLARDNIVTKSGNTYEGEPEVCFAFKPINDDSNASGQLKGTTWWSLGEGDPKANPFRVSEKGIGNEYTLTYNAGGGTGDDIVSKVFGGDTVKAADCTFTNEGKRFVYWTSGKAEYEAGVEFTMPEEYVTLTAVWVNASASENLTVTYAGGAGAQGNAPVDSGSYKAGDAFTVQGQGDLTLEGYRFMGWKDQNQKEYKAGETAYFVEDSLTLTAQWAEEFTLTYELPSDVGTGSAPTGGNYIEGEEVVLPSKAPAHSDPTLEFYAWQDKEGHVYLAGSTFEMPNKAVTLTAAYRKKLAVDGDLSDWQALGSKTLSSNSFTDQRGATWYGAMSGDGLYLAAELWHNEEPRNGQGNWFDNLNFEIRIKNSDGANHYYVYVTGKDGENYTFAVGRDAGGIDGIKAEYKHESGDPRATHHSIFEIFIPASNYSQVKETDGSLRLGLAVKTGPYEKGDHSPDAERLNGGTVNYDGGDTWYAPYGVWPDDPNMFAYVNDDGLTLPEEHEHPDWTFGPDSAIADDDGITIDGNLEDWAGIKTIGVTGTVQYFGKSVTFYGKLTKAGLYLAAEAYHGTFTTGQGDWWNNTNLELRIGRNWGGDGSKMPRQFWVNATADGCAVSAVGMQAKLVHETVTGHNNATEHTIIEVFIPTEVFLNGQNYMIRNGMIQVGVAWKTNGDNINNGTIDNDPWVMPFGEHVNSNPACVDGTGIYLSGDYGKQA